MKILVACALPEQTLSDLRSLGSAVVYEPLISAAQLGEHIQDAGIVIVGQTAVTPEAIQRASALQMIVVAGSGGAQVAIDEASAQGVFVTHCPRKDAIACAELALGLLLALDRNIVTNAERLREGRWEREGFTASRGLSGQTLGLIGDDAFCDALAPRARALGMQLLAWTPENDGPAPLMQTKRRHTAVEIERCQWPREIARRCGMIAIHATAQTMAEPVISEDFLDCLGAGTALVHIGDLSVSGEQALAASIEAKQLRVALDVRPSEPSSQTSRVRSPLLKLPGVIGTHHLSGATQQARLSIGREIVRIVSAFLINGEPLNTLNLLDRSPATWQLVMRLRDQVGVMAAVLDAIRADGINAEDVLSRVFVGAKAAWCTISLDERPSTEALNAIRALPDVLHLELRAVV